jgi:DNA-binding transcriptional regulator YhcF (GntR family)
VKTKTEQLAARIEQNRRGAIVDEALAAELLDAYLSRAKPSYRALAAQHKLATSTVMRAIKRAAKVAL